MNVVARRKTMTRCGAAQAAASLVLAYEFITEGTKE
jgi:hypothetical protein